MLRSDRLHDFQRLEEIGAREAVTLGVDHGLGNVGGVAEDEEGIFQHATSRRDGFRFVERQIAGRGKHARAAALACRLGDAHRLGAG